MNDEKNQVCFLECWHYENFSNKISLVLLVKLPVLVNFGQMNGQTVLIVEILATILTRVHKRVWKMDALNVVHQIAFVGR